MNTQTRNTTTNATIKATRKAPSTKAKATKPRYSWSKNPDALTWKQVGRMGCDEMEACLEARGFGDAGSADIGAIIESTNKWVMALAHLGEKNAYSVLAVARALFIHERSIRDGESED